MDIVSWMYVSECLVAPESHQSVLDDIVAVSRKRNHSLDTTGCLIFARNRFAQMLEGPPASVAELRKSIEADSRHTDVRTLATDQIGTRWFSGWSLAYAGRSLYVERAMDETIREISKSGERSAVTALLLLMREFGSPN
jgi:hypothetical protein